MAKVNYRYHELKQIIPYRLLYDYLWDKNLTYKEIAKMYNVDQHQISRLSKEYNIPKNTVNIGEMKNKNRILYFDNMELFKLYCEELKSLRQIASIYKTTHGTIANKIRKLGIDIRDAYDPIYYKNRKRRLANYHINENGYLMFGRQYVHRLIMEEKLNRQLVDDETVHHLDFNKLNNSPDNLYLFIKNNIHLFYHGYIEKHEYISPDDYIINYYNKYLINTYENSNWLHNQYIVSRKSANEISLELDITRQSVVDKLKYFEIYQLRPPTINQYDIGD